MQVIKKVSTVSLIMLLSMQSVSGMHFFSRVNISHAASRLGGAAWGFGNLVSSGSSKLVSMIPDKQEIASGLASTWDRVKGLGNEVLIIAQQHPRLGLAAFATTTTAAALAMGFAAYKIGKKKPTLANTAAQELAEQVRAHKLTRFDTGMAEEPAPRTAPVVNPTRPRRSSEPGMLTAQEEQHAQAIMFALAKELLEEQEYADQDPVDIAADGKVDALVGDDSAMPIATAQPLITAAPAPAAAASTNTHHKRAHAKKERKHTTSKRKVATLEAMQHAAQQDIATLVEYKKAFDAYVNDKSNEETKKAFFKMMHYAINDEAPMKSNVQQLHVAQEQLIQWQKDFAETVIKAQTLITCLNMEKTEKEFQDMVRLLELASADIQ